MKIDLHHYMHGGNGMALELSPETDVERGLLIAFFSHGEMVVGNGRGGQGFRICWKPNKDNEQLTRG